MRVDDADDVARDPFRIAARMPLRLDERMRAGHAGVDQDEAVGMVDRVREDGERSAERLHVGDEVCLDHLFVTPLGGHNEGMIGVGIAFIIVGIIFLFIVPWVGIPVGIIGLVLAVLYFA